MKKYLMLKTNNQEGKDAPRYEMFEKQASSIKNKKSLQIDKFNALLKK